MRLRSLTILFALSGFVAVCVFAAEPKPAAGKKAVDKDFSAELPRIPPKKPAEALKELAARPGFQVEVAAAEPLLRSPVAIDFDEDGRLYVAEYPEYNDYASKKPHGKGAIRLLEDTNDDGVYDKSTLFADNVPAAVAVACWDGGVFVGSVPHLLYLKDTTGDGKADVRKTVLTGFARDAAGEAMLNSLRWTFENKFRIQTNLGGGDVRRADRPDSQPINARGQMLLFDPRTGEIEPTGGGGQHGMCLDDWGRCFVCGNSDPFHLILYDSRYLSRNPYLQAPAAAVNIAPAGKFTKLHRISPNEPWRVLRTRLRKEGTIPGSDEGGQPSGFFTGGTGVTVYRGDAFPEEYRGNLFVADVANNIVHRALPVPNGVSLTAKSVEEGREFLASRDNWFRPVQMANAPDGCLYVVDMPRELIEGAAFLAPVILKHMDTSNGTDLGRIWRVVPTGHKRRPAPKLSKATSADLVALLEHPNGWHRDTAARLLYQRQDRTVIDALDRMVVRTMSPLARVHALAVLDGLGALTPRLLGYGLRHAEPRVRIETLRMAERHLGNAETRGHVEPLLEDTDLEVRYQLAFTLGAMPADLPPTGLKRLAARDGSDRWVRLAILSSLHGRMGHMFGLCVSDQEFLSIPHAANFLTELAGLIGRSSQPAEIKRLIESCEVLGKTDRELARNLVLAMIAANPAALARVDRLPGSFVREILASRLAEARQTASDAKKPVEARATALRSLALAKYSEIAELLAESLATRQPPEVQIAAVETLGRFEDPAVPAQLLSAWPAMSPRLRATTTETLLSRPAWIAAFLDAVEKGVVQRSDLDPARIDLLKKYPDATLRGRVVKLFAGTGLSKRADVVAEYQKALTLKGDRDRGRTVFRQHCAACHQLEGFGAQIGADLKAIKDQGNDAILLNILDPNREVKPQFQSYVIETKAGKVLSGMIKEETANSLTVRKPDNTDETVLRLDVEELRSTGLSFMPEGFEKQINLQAMADLLTYLNAVK